MATSQLLQTVAPQDDRGRTFFIDHSRKVTTWDDPRLGGGAAAAAKGKAKAKDKDDGCVVC